MIPSQLAPLALSVLAGCWTRAPGPAALTVAEGPVATFEERVPANAIDLVLAVRAGSAHDPVGQEGLAWLTAHGVARTGGAELEQRLYEMGTHLEVEVGPELTTFRLRCRVEDAVACAEVLGGAVATPDLGADVLEDVRGHVRAHLDEQAHGPARRLADQVFDRWTFEGHPYGHDPAGRPGALDALTSADLVRFHQGHYLRPATALGIAGLPTAEAVVDVQAALAGLPPRLGTDATPRRLPAVEGRRLLVLSAPVPETRIVLGHATELAPDHPDRVAVEAGLGVLGQGPDSRLGRSLRSGDGLDVDVAVGLDPVDQRLQPALRIALGPAEGQALPTIASALGALRQMVDEGPSADELALWQAAAAGRTEALAATPRSRARSAAVHHLLGAPLAVDRLTAVAALTPQAVQAALARHVDPDNLRIVVVTATPGAFDGLALEGSEPSPVGGGDDVVAPDYGVGISAVIRASAQELLR